MPPSLLVATAALAQDKVPLKTQLPRPLFVGTPVPLNVPNLEPPMKGKRPDFMVPAGSINLAKGKKVTAQRQQSRGRNAGPGHRWRQGRR